MSEERIIKKYANRRLYDTRRSVYVTLADVRELVSDGVDFVVYDDATGEDITRQVLLQVITEQENGGHPMFTKELLTQMIRFYGGAYQSMFTDHMQQAVQMISSQQQAYQRQLSDIAKQNMEIMAEMQNKMLDAAGFSTASDIARQNIELWTEMQNNMLKMSGLHSGDDDEQ